MSEPATTTSGIAIGTGVITLTGSVLGLQFDVLLLGLFGGLFALQHVGPFPTRWHVASGLAMSSFLGGALAPLADSLAHSAHIKDWLTESFLPAGAPRLAGALLVGLAAQIMVPAALGWIKARFVRE